MILKSADDKTPQTAQLAQLSTNPHLGEAQRKWATDELFRLRMGIKGEQDAAFYLDSHFKDSPNHVVIHDVRLEVDGDVAQIDHMVFYRAGGLYLFETKNYSGNLHINAHGEFTAEYGRVRIGIPSPLEQSRRHEKVLSKLLERLEISSRVQKALDMHHLVLLHPKAIIHRPPEKAFNTSNVIKADQFPEWHRKFVDSRITALEALRLMANMRSIDTLKEWGEKLLRQHRRMPLKSLPDHLFPSGLPGQVNQSIQASTAKPLPVDGGKAVVAQSDTSHLAKKLICAQCGEKITFPEGKFCWGNEKRFGGLQYCRAHQALFR